MDFKVILLILSIVFTTAGLFLASRLMGVSLTLIQALIASVVMSIVSSLFGSSSEAGLAAIIAAFLISIVPLRLMTAESMWGTVKLSIVGTIIGAALLMASVKVFFPIPI